jgi:polyphosphate glucokinase
VIETIAELAAHHQYDRVAVGFPGVVRQGVTITAPNLHKDWHGFPFAAALAERLGKPVRVANDADVQGFGAISGHGLEMVLTLGTGLGSSLFVDGILVPNLELAHHPFVEGKTYEQWLGQASLEQLGTPLWLEWLNKAIVQLRNTFNFDVLYLGGGNARMLDQTKMPADVRIVPNIAGLLGGIALWTEMYGTELVRAPHSEGAYCALQPGTPHS